jgi:hypothetical protein
MDGDSLLLFDLNQHRLTIFGSDGEPVRTVAVGPLNLGYNPAIGPLEDRSFLVPTAHGARQPPSENGLLRRDSLVYRRFSTTGEELPPFGAYPGRETFLLPDGPRRTLLEPLGFGRSFELVSGDSLIYLGQTDSYEVRAFTHAGQLRQIIRVMLDPVPVTSAMIAAFKDHNIEIYGDSVMIAGFRRVREAMPYPATTPAFLQLAVDDEQNLWVRQYPAFPDSSAIWHIFSPTGHLSGRVELPARFEPNVFQSYVITGIWTDDESVEHLRSYALERRNRS